MVPPIRLLSRPVAPAAIDSIEALICSYPWPQGCDYWVRICDCESSLGTDPWAYDPRNPYTGAFQIWRGHGYGHDWLIIDANNVLAAWELSNGGVNTAPWPACRYQ